MTTWRRAGEARTHRAWPTLTPGRHSDHVPKRARRRSTTHLATVWFHGTPMPAPPSGRLFVPPPPRPDVTSARGRAANRPSAARCCKIYGDSSHAERWQRLATTVAAYRGQRDDTTPELTTISPSRSRPGRWRAWKAPYPLTCAYAKALMNQQRRSWRFHNRLPVVGCRLMSDATRVNDHLWRFLSGGRHHAPPGDRPPPALRQRVKDDEGGGRRPPKVKTRHGRHRRASRRLGPGANCRSTWFTRTSAGRTRNR